MSPLLTLSLLLCAGCQSLNLSEATIKIDAAKIRTAITLIEAAVSPELWAQIEPWADQLLAIAEEYDGMHFALADWRIIIDEIRDLISQGSGNTKATPFLALLDG